MSSDQLSQPEFFAQYEQAWQRVSEEWEKDVAEIRGWLTYSANYIFKSGKLAWGVDPFMPYTLLGAEYPGEIPNPLHELDMILLTHEHSDHWDEKLYRALAGRPRVWLVPKHLARSLEQAGVPAEQIKILLPGESWNQNEFQAIAHEGCHKEGAFGPESLSWEIKTRNQRLMFFGDVRNYDASFYPCVQDVDVSFAHVWLGRGEAMKQVPALLPSFCRFHEHFQPKHLILTHLNERSRIETDRWKQSHVDLIREELSKKIPMKAPGILEHSNWLCTPIN